MTRPDNLENLSLAARVARLEEIEADRHEGSRRLSSVVSFRNGEEYLAIRQVLLDHQRGITYLNKMRALGMSARRWAMEEPHLATKIIILIIGIGATFVAYQETQAAIAAAQFIPDQLQRLMEATFAYDPRLIKAGAAVPSVRIIPGEGLLAIPKVDVGVPNLSAALQPMLEGQRQTYEAARQALNQQIDQTLDHTVSGVKWGLVGLGGVSSPFTHPWERLVKKPVDLAGRCLDAVGRIFP